VTLLSGHEKMNEKKSEQSGPAERDSAFVSSMADLSALQNTARILVPPDIGVNLSKHRFQKSSKQAPVVAPVSKRVSGRRVFNIDIPGDLWRNSLGLERCGFTRVFIP